MFRKPLCTAMCGIACLTMASCSNIRREFFGDEESLSGSSGSLVQCSYMGIANNSLDVISIGSYGLAGDGIRIRILGIYFQDRTTGFFAVEVNNCSGGIISLPVGFGNSHANRDLFVISSDGGEQWETISRPMDNFIDSQKEVCILFPRQSVVLSVPAGHYGVAGLRAKPSIGYLRNQGVPESCLTLDDIACVSGAFPADGSNLVLDSDSSYGPSIQTIRHLLSPLHPARKGKNVEWVPPERDLLDRRIYTR